MDDLKGRRVSLNHIAPISNFDLDLRGKIGTVVGDAEKTGVIEVEMDEYFPELVGWKNRVHFHRESAKNKGFPEAEEQFRHCAFSIVPELEKYIGLVFVHHSFDAPRLIVGAASHNKFWTVPLRFSDYTAHCGLEKSEAVWQTQNLTYVKKDKVEEGHLHSQGSELYMRDRKGFYARMRESRRELGSMTFKKAQKVLRDLDKEIREEKDIATSAIHYDFVFMKDYKDDPSVIAVLRNCDGPAVIDIPIKETDEATFVIFAALFVMGFSLEEIKTEWAYLFQHDLDEYEDRLRERMNAWIPDGI